MSNLDSNRIPRQVWGYYHPFYGTPDGPTGRWLTWNEPLWLSTGYGYTSADVPPVVQEKLKHDPDLLISPGRRSNYSAFYPTLGLYDCLDSKVLEQQAGWAVEGGLDGLMWDYMLVGEDNSDKEKPLEDTIYDRSFRAMLQVIGSLGIEIDLCPWYDSFCWYGYPAEKIAEHLGYMARTYHGHPHALHIDGRLVVYIYSTLGKHTVGDWLRVRDLLSKDGGIDRRLFLVAGEMPAGEAPFNEPGLFDGFSQYNYGMEDWNADGVTRRSRELRGLTESNGAKFWSATIGPGFDGRVWHHPGRVVARGLGGLYESMWEAAIAAQPNFVTICSFNEWGEGTEIEPCLEYEDLYLKLTAKWARVFRREAPHES